MKSTEFILSISFERLSIVFKFEVVEKPNDWTKEIKKINSGLNATQQARVDYWTAFNGYAFNNQAFSKEFKKRKPAPDHWMSFSIGSSACGINILRLQNEGHIAVEFYINDDKNLFHSLYSQKDEIEKEIGFQLDWRELPEKKASRILAETEVNLVDATDWPSQFDWLSGTMLKMKKTFKKRLKQMPTSIYNSQR